MEYPTCQLYFLGIHTSIGFCVCQQNKSDSWNIMVYHHEALPSTLYVQGRVENTKWQNNEMAPLG